ncbi:unnamed protein product [Adineta steineri]|nr:unnamed protein product [Adineta steineri]
MPNDDLFSALFFDDEKYVQKRFLTKIQQTADLLWNGWMKRDFTYKDYELQFLRDTYQLNTKLIYSNQISPRQKQERHYVLKYTSPLSEFTDILLDSIYLKTLQAVLAVVNAFIVSSSAYSGLLELTMWLDTYTYFNKRFPSEHGTIAFRNGLKYFVEYKEKKELKQITEILWTLSFHPLIQKQFRKDESLLASLRKCSKEKGDIRSTILWTLGDHTGLANTELKRSEHENTGYTVYSNIQKWEDLVPYKVILDHTSDDNKICKNIANHLCLYGFRTFRQLSISLLQSNSLDSMKSIIVCLSEYYEQCNISRAILQYSTKKQFNIIPIIIQKTYKPQGWVKEVLNKTHIMDFTQLPFIDSLNMLIDVIKSMESKVETSSVETVTNDTVQTEDVSLDLFTICRRNNVTKLRKYVGKMTIDQINRIGPNGETALHVATNHGHKEIIQLLLDNEASRSIRNQITNRAAYEENLTLEIKQLFQRPKHENRFLANSSLEVFEWTLHYNDPVLQRSQFRRRLINPFKVDRNIVRSTLNKDQLSSIFRVTLANFSDNFLSTLSSNEIAARHKSFIEWFFQQAIMKVDSTFILKAYTSATNFYGILNKTLAKFALEYFDAILQESTDYKALISTIDLISLLINDADLDKHNYRGTTYRGMLLRNEDLVKYVVGSKLMNISFVSTSKDREIAEIFAGQNSESTLSEIPAVCIYTIRNMGTALDVEEISEIPDEREVLVLPFSAFQIRCIRRLDKTVNKGIMVELELEECDEYQGENNSSKRQRLLLMSLLEQSDMNLII